MMKIPSNHNEQETLDIMKKVINRISPKYVFYGYTIDDIKQESYIICIEALERYDETRPLENFLSVNLSNRLKNFIRDNYFIISDDEEKNESKIKVLQPAQLDYEFNIVDDGEKYSVNDEQIDLSEMSSVIDRELPSSLRMEYLKMINNIYVNKFKKEEILHKIDEILTENGYEKR
jgi:DNA-directed RNA polymerase specialized sigma24 family protein